MRIALALIALAGFAAAGDAPQGPLVKGKDVVFIERTGSLPFLKEAAIRYRVVEPDETLASSLLTFAPFVRAVDEYEALRTRLKGRAAPIYLAFEPSMNRTAYCAEQPFLLSGADAAKGRRARLVTAAIIHVTRPYLEDMRKGKSQSVVCHEIGHAFMSLTHGMLAYPGASPELLIDYLTEEGHWYTKETDPVFSWSEGWAEFTEYHYTGADLPASLLRKEEKGKPRTLTGTEIRRREGAQAYLLLALDRDEKIASFYDSALQVMAKTRPQSMNGLLRAFVEAHPEEKEEVERVVAEKSDHAFSIQYDYTSEDYWQDSKDNWGRLWDKVLDRLGGR